MNKPFKNQLRIFISSTFRDMQPERDELVKKVFPRVQDRCERDGVLFSSVDLRWGITETQASEGKIVPICFQEIDLCQPFFIGIIGERYGSVIEDLPEGFLNEHTWMKEHLDKSVTELEILYGALRRDVQKTRAYFYLKKSTASSGEDYEMLERLRSAIRNSGYPYQFYRTPEELGNLLEADLQAAIEALIPQEGVADDLERERYYHESFALVRAQLYVGEKKYFNLLDRFVTSRHKPLVLYGPAGIGKSSLLANWFLRKQDYPFEQRLYLDRHLTDEWRHFLTLAYHRLHNGSKYRRERYIIHFVGASRQSNDWYLVVRRLMMILQREFDLDLALPQKEEGLSTGLINWFNAIPKEERVVLIIDGLDQLEDREQALHLGWIPTQLPPNIRLILSSSGGPSLQELKRRKWNLTEVKPWATSHARSFTQQYLAQFGKTLGGEHTSQIVQNPLARRPLFLKTFLEEIRVFGYYEHLSERVGFYMQARSLKALFKKVLQRMESDELVIDRQIIGDSMRLLWAARKGLVENELLSLLGSGETPLPDRYWSPVFLTLKGIILQQSGYLSLTSGDFRSAVEELYLPEDEKRKTHLRLAGFFSKSRKSNRFIDELPWHLSIVQQWDQLYALLSDPTFVRISWPNNEYELKEYWTLIEEKTHYSKREAFQNILDRPDTTERERWLIAKLLTDSGHYALALTLLRELESGARQKQDAAFLQQVLSLRAVALTELGSLDEALQVLAEEETYCRRSHKNHLLSACLGNQGALWLRLGDADAAGRCFEEEATLARQIGDFVGLCINQGNRGIVQLNQKNEKVAGRLFEEQEKTARMVGYLPGLAHALINKGILQYRQEKPGKALKAFADAGKISRELGARQVLQEVLGKQAMVYMDLGNYDQAFELLEERERLNLEMHNFFELINTYYQLVELFTDKLGQARYSLQYVDKARDIARRNGIHSEMEKIEKLSLGLNKAGT